MVNIGYRLPRNANNYWLFSNKISWPLQITPYNKLYNYIIIANIYNEYYWKKGKTQYWENSKLLIKILLHIMTTYWVELENIGSRWRAALSLVWRWWCIEIDLVWGLQYKNGTVKFITKYPSFPNFKNTDISSTHNTWRHELNSPVHLAHHGVWVWTWQVFPYALFHWGNAWVADFDQSTCTAAEFHAFSHWPSWCFHSPRFFLA